MQTTKTIVKALTWIAAGILLLPTAATAEIYKWVDATGQVHFTDEPPENKGTKVQLDVPKPSATPDAGEIRRLELVSRVQRETQHKASMKEAALQAKPPELTNDSPGCKPARHRWYALTQEMPVYWTEDRKIRALARGDTYKGNRNYIDDDDRQALLSKTVGEIEAYCPGGEVDDEEDSQYAAWLRVEDCSMSRARLEMALKSSSRTSREQLAIIKDEVRAFCD